MNRQEAFDKAYKGIVAQGCISLLDNSFNCAYRGADGAKCAVGHLITDEQITKYAIGNTVAVYSFPEELIAELLPEDDDAMLFFEELQGVHDGAGGVSEFKTRAAKFAKEYKLTVPE